eukprot:CAMPEP_0179618654 /NCGR_PEP_ID=MMETSP0930-20121108/7791_1 /TAXON_ID=548131 ORGANISM="Ostreococcus mediterraneus, Strain clade-D-RCC1621" /NCGR_SAMPLE_ID=MMETSP0930 /ASSEMBLY_ACC=CAM_ASM_000580 /LENGTH=42 /DNA_ID= /DNA_START= /DNA_END= /DNA_ORIENTATION=
MRRQAYYFRLNPAHARTGEAEVHRERVADVPVQKPPRADVGP